MIGRLRPTLFAILFLTAMWPPPASALTIDSDQQYQFAETLYNNRQYQRAAEEYQRFAFFFPQDSRQRKAIFKAGQAFLRAQDPATALDLFKRLTELDRLDSVAIESYFMMVECHLQMKSFPDAVLDLNNLIILSDDADVRDRAYYRLGWLHIDQTDWLSARQAFSKISTNQRSRYKIDDLDQSLDSATQLPTRNPTLAGTLSIVPGAGQLYCNRYEDALIAFIVNLGLFWAAHDAFDEDQYALGGLISFVGLGFYTGNIYSAVSDAHKFNKLQRQRFRSYLSRHLVIGAAPADPQTSAKVFIGLRVPY